MIYRQAIKMRAYLSIRQGTPADSAPVDGKKLRETKSRRRGQARMLSERHCTLHTLSTFLTWDRAGDAPLKADAAVSSANARLAARLVRDCAKIATAVPQ